MAQENNKAIDQILDLLLDALSERERERESNPDLPADIEIDKSQGSEPLQTAEAKETASQEEIHIESEAEDTEIEAATETDANAALDDSEIKALKSEEEIVDLEVEEIDLVEEEAEEYGGFFYDRLTTEKLPTIHMNKIFYRMCVSLIALIIIINIPFTFRQYRTNLATAMPDKRALLIRNGLMFKGPGDEIYFLDEGEKRWVTSLTAFELSGFSWSQVHLVDQEFVDQFEDGPDFNVLIRCKGQPHIYLLEGDEKRWIQNPIEFEKAGFKWEYINYISCRDLEHKYPDGDPIPLDAGEPPSW